MSLNYQDIGVKLKALRILKGYPLQRDLGEAAGLKTHQISYMEQGKSITLDNLHAIASAYQMPTWELLRELMGEDGKKGAA